MENKERSNCQICQLCVVGNLGKTRLLASQTLLHENKKSSNKMLPQWAMNLGSQSLGSDALLSKPMRDVLLGRSKIFIRWSNRRQRKQTSGVFEQIKILGLYCLQLSLIQSSHLICTTGNHDETSTFPHNISHFVLLGIISEIIIYFELPSFVLYAF